MFSARQPCVLITGMSGTGKSTVLAELRLRGFLVHDMDEQNRSYVDDQGHQRWNVAELVKAIEENRNVPFFISECSEDQASIRPLLTHVVLLSLPIESLIKRIASRTSHDFEKSPAELAAILVEVERTEPLLRKNATLEIDTTMTVGAVASRILRLCGLIHGWPNNRIRAIHGTKLCSFFSLENIEFMNLLPSAVF